MASNPLHNGEILGGRELSREQFVPRGETPLGPTGARDEPNALICFAFGFLAAASLLAGTGGSRLAVLVFLVAVAGWTAVFSTMVARNAVSNSLLFAFPLVTTLSVLWSQHPGASFYYSLQIYPTLLAAIILGTAKRRPAMMAGTFAALLGYVLVSLGEGHSVVVGTTGEEAFSGITASKNFFGHLASLTVITALFLLPASHGRAKPAFLLLFALGVLLGAYGVVNARAAGSMLALGAALALFGLIVVVANASKGIKVIAAVSAVSLMILITLFYSQIQDALSHLVLSTFRKDRGLTGRDYLWHVADRLIAAKPWLGLGYRAFWVQNDLEPEMIWRHMGITTRMGFNFHNSFREVLVETGILGFVVYVVTLAVRVGRRFVNAMLQPRLESAASMALIAYFMVRMPVESTGFGGLSLDMLLLFSCLCVAARPPGDPVPRHAPVQVVRHGKPQRTGARFRGE